MEPGFEQEYHGTINIVWKMDKIPRDLLVSVQRCESLVWYNLHAMQVSKSDEGIPRIAANPHTNPGLYEPWLSSDRTKTVVGYLYMEN